VIRDAVIASVAARHPVDERERRSQAATLAWLDSLASPFDRDADPVHVTASGIITGPQGVLLLEHRRLHIWVQPGGHIERGEAPWEAALRESEEETGLRLTLVGAPGERTAPPLMHVDVHPSAGGHTHLDLRYALTVEGDTEPHPPEGESQEVRWYPWPDAVAIADAGLAGLLSHLSAAAAGASDRHTAGFE
jgi:8-oxo-dGTP pyrophosphatase MutT (NUDIX family)